MARKHDLRVLREGTVINRVSKRQEERLLTALYQVEDCINKTFSVRLQHDPEWRLADIVHQLRQHHPSVDFHCYFPKSAMRPDGGVLSLLDLQDRPYPILITEVKNQGTNDLRVREGKEKQAKGNAIERLGKNVIGFRTALLHESIFPFVCFGDGCDFAPDSSILDRVVTIAMFGQLNKTRVANEGDRGIFNRGSFYFRSEPWTPEEMAAIMTDIAERSIYYYFSKYGKDKFIR